MPDNLQAYGIGLTMNDAHRAEAAARRNEITAGVVGAVFIVGGLLGFTLAGDHSLTGHQGGQSIGVFRINTLHNLVHVALGAVLIAAPIADARLARRANLVVGSGLLVLATVGFFMSGDERWNVISLNGPDGLVHLAFGVTLLLLATGPAVASRRRSSYPRDDHEVRGPEPP
jgi:hypothetical protein